VGAKLALRQVTTHPGNCEVYHKNKSNKQGRVAKNVSGLC
jgi:hypothetical protein